MKQKHHEMHSRQWQFTEGETVYVKDFSGREDWLPGAITKIQGPLSYLIELENQQVVHRHVDHIRKRVSLVEPTDHKQTDKEELLRPEISDTLTETDTRVVTQRPVRSHKHPSRLIEELNQQGGM